MILILTRKNDLMQKDDKNRHGRPESYPQPTEADEQLKNQPEYIDQQPNDFRDKSISDLPAHNRERESNEPGKER